MTFCHLAVRHRRATCRETVDARHEVHAAFAEGDVGVVVEGREQQVALLAVVAPRRHEGTIERSGLLGAAGVRLGVEVDAAIPFYALYQCHRCVSRM